MSFARGRLTFSRSAMEDRRCAWRWALWSRLARFPTNAVTGRIRTRFSEDGSMRGGLVLPTGPRRRAVRRPVHERGTATSLACLAALVAERSCDRLQPAAVHLVMMCGLWAKALAGPPPRRAINLAPPVAYGGGETARRNLQIAARRYHIRTRKARKVLALQ